MIPCHLCCPTTARDPLNTPPKVLQLFVLNLNPVQHTVSMSITFSTHCRNKHLSFHDEGRLIQTWRIVTWGWSLPDWWMCCKPDFSTAPSSTREHDYGERRVHRPGSLEECDRTDILVTHIPNNASENHSSSTLSIPFPSILQRVASILGLNLDPMGILWLSHWRLE